MNASYRRTGEDVAAAAVAAGGSADAGATSAYEPRLRTATRAAAAATNGIASGPIQPTTTRHCAIEAGVQAISGCSPTSSSRSSTDVAGLRPRYSRPLAVYSLPMIT